MPMREILEERGITFHCCPGIIFSSKKIKEKGRLEKLLSRHGYTCIPGVDSPGLFNIVSAAINEDPVSEASIQIKENGKEKMAGFAVIEFFILIGTPCNCNQRALCSRFFNIWMGKTIPSNIPVSAPMLKKDGVMF